MLSRHYFSFNSALEYAIMKVQEDHVGLKLKGTHQLLVYADDVNLLGDNTDTTKKNTETLICPSKEVGLEANAEKTNCTLPSRHQNAGQNHDLKIVSRCFEYVAKFRYLETTITNQNLIQEKITRLNINLLSVRLLSACETWSLSFKGGTQTEVFENRALRRTFGPKRDEVT
jgi:hypothetical protein